MLQLVPSEDTSSVYAEAYAPSHRMRTVHSGYDAPRSTTSHCGSANALSHRVPLLPSIALPAEPRWSLDALADAPAAAARSVLPGELHMAAGVAAGGGSGAGDGDADGGGGGDCMGLPFACVYSMHAASIVARKAQLDIMFHGLSGRTCEL